MTQPSVSPSLPTGLRELIERMRKSGDMHEQRATEAKDRCDTVNFNRQDAYAYAARLHAGMIEAALASSHSLVAEMFDATEVTRIDRVDPSRWQAPSASAHTWQPEVCLCAALQMPDGYIVRGHRHNDAMQTAGNIPRYKDQVRGVPQGFVTSRGRFVDRTEGCKLQKAAGIESVDSGNAYLNGELYSEDLY